MTYLYIVGVKQQVEEKLWEQGVSQRDVRIISNLEDLNGLPDGLTFCVAGLYYEVPDVNRILTILNTQKNASMISFWEAENWIKENNG